MPACLPLGASVNGGRLQAGRRLGRSSLSSFEAGLDEANHLVHEFEQFGGAGGSRQGLGLIAFVELTQAGDGRQCRYARDQAVSGLAEVFADGLGEGAFEGVVAGAGASPEFWFVADDVRSQGAPFPEA